MCAYENEWVKEKNLRYSTIVWFIIVLVTIRICLISMTILGSFQFSNSAFVVDDRQSI